MVTQAIITIFVVKLETGSAVGVALSFLRRLKLSIVILRIGLKASDNERAKHAALEPCELLARLRGQGC